MKKLIIFLLTVSINFNVLAEKNNNGEIVFENFNNPEIFLKKYTGYGNGIKDTTKGKFANGNAYEGEYSLKIVYQLKKGNWGVAVKRVFENKKDLSGLGSIELYVKNDYEFNGSNHFFEIQLRSESGSKWISKQIKLSPNKWTKIVIPIQYKFWKLNRRDIDKELFYNDLRNIKSIRFYLRNEKRSRTEKEEFYIDYIVFHKATGKIRNSAFDTTYLSKINNRIKRIIGKKKLGVYVYTYTLSRYFNRYKLLAEEMNRLAVDEVYLSVKIKDFENKKIYKSEIKDFIYNLKNKIKGIKIYAIVGYGFKGFTEKGYFEDSVNKILNYNKEVAVKEKFDGFSFDIEPHIMKKGRGIDKSYPYRWGTYGIGKDNDMLMKDTLQLLKKARNIIRGKKLQISEALAHFFYDHYLKKDLSVGSINDFLDTVNYIILMDYSDDVKKIIRFAEKEITDAKKANSIMIAFKTKSNKMGNSDTTFWEEGIKSLDSAIKKVYLKYRNSKSFRGIAIFEYDSFIKLYKRK